MYEDASAALVRAELDRILASEIFSRSDRLSAFLKFIVQQTLSGHGHTLKEQVIAIELYGKGPGFNTAADPIVRVDARRLRDHLREYYASAPQDLVIISVPKGSYTPVFQRNGRAFLSVSDAGSASDDPDADHVQPAILAAGERQSAPRSRGVQWIAIGAIVIVLGLVVAILRTRGGRQDYSPVRLLTVTSLPGAEEDPSLSPDGSFVAYSWTKPAPSSHSEIWVKAVDGDAVRQLTDTSDALEKWPEWSPDGQYISFTRLDKKASSVFVVSPLGGTERMITDRGGDATWLPDGRSLIMVSRSATGRWTLVHHVLAAGARRQLLEAQPGFMLAHPRVSPDGKTVVYATYGEGRSALFVIPVSGGPPKQVGNWHSGVIGGQTWSPDGREIFYGRPESSWRHLVRIPAAGSEPPVSIAGIPLYALAPAVSRPRAEGTYRLAFVSGEYDVSLRLIDLDAARQDRTITAVAPFCDGTRLDAPGRFSPDDSQVAFVSNRGGSQQVWVAGRDESALRSVTRLQGATINIGSWSPDGQWVAFDATVAGNTDIYVIRVDGGSLKRLTESTATEIDPEWSRDGRWIYFSSNASGAAAIWKMPASGGRPVLLTSDVGFDPHESPDGKDIYFIDRGRLFGLGLPGVLKRVASEGGATSKVDVAVAPGAWDVTDKGIVFLIKGGGGFDPSDTPDVLALYDFADQRVHEIGPLNFLVARAATARYLAGSRDGRWILTPHLDRQDRDIMLVDNFR
jgi:Tol biopolymer transport system component